MLIIHEAFWNSYEEYGFLTIYQQPTDTGVAYLYIEFHSSVFSSDDEEPTIEDAIEISENEVLRLIEEWDKIEQDCEQYWEENA